MPAAEPASPRARRAVAALAALLLARLALHAFFVPPFEGPDEPFHLSRAMAVARDGWPGLRRAVPLGVEVQRAIARHPCAADLRRAFGCPPFPGAAAGPAPAAAPVRADSPNYENNQPPLYYAVAGAYLYAAAALAPPAAGREPEADLLRLRLLSLAFSAAALFGPLRRFARRRSPAFAHLGLAAMFLPGFAEALVRASNDALLFLWTALVVESMDREARGPMLPALLALGCLVKLTALPVLAFALAVLWRERRRALAVVSLAAAILPALVLGASTWGGAVKIAKRLPAAMPAGEVAAGLARSLYTVGKGTAWMGEWSFFRPPFWLLVLGLFLAAVLAARVRMSLRCPRFPAHLAGIAVAAAGTIAFILTDRRVFGAWAGVGGWYVWGWAPWLAAAFDDVFAFRRREWWPLAAAGAYVLLMNALWFGAAGRLYGPRSGLGGAQAVVREAILRA